MLLKRTGIVEFNLQRQVFGFKMLSDEFQIRFTISLSVVRDLDGREVMPGQFVSQFNRQREKIEKVAQQVFSSLQSRTSGPVALQRAHFFN